MDTRDQETSLTGAKPASGGRPILTSFLDYLVKNGVITRQIALQAASYKRNHETDRRSITELLEQEFDLERDTLRHQVALYYAFRIVEFSERSPRRHHLADAKKLLRGLPEASYQLAVKHKVLPYDLAENQPDKLVVVTPTPADREIHEVLRSYPFKKFEVCYMRESDWTLYWDQLTAEIDKPAAGPAGDIIAESVESDLETIIDREISRANLTALMENLLADAARSGATDLHLVPRGPRKTEFLFRIDGQLSLWFSLDDARTEAVSAAMKSRALGLDRYEHMAVQEGTLQRTVDNRIVRYRMSVVPVHARDAAARYEFVQIRILHEVDAAPTLETLGMDAQTLGILHESLAAPYGLTLFAGIPSRMAKSVLAAALRAVMKPALSAVMLEKTPEFFVEGARQIKLNPKLSFADGLQVLDELDPDIVVLDEIRDAQAVAIALTLASGGKKVMATLSAPDAPGALSAVLAHTPDPYRLAYGLHAIVAVSTLRRLCPRCKHRAPPVAAIPGVQAISAADLQNIPRHKAVGCIDCLGGYRGVVPVFEAFPATSELRDLLLSHPSLPLDAAIADSLQRTGYRPMLQSALDLLTQGITTVEEVGRIAR